MADEERPFLISVRRRWTLWILPVLATLYFLTVILLNVLDYEIAGVGMDMLVLVGVALFVIVLLIELPFLLRRRAKREPEPEPAPIGEPLAASRNGWDDELLITPESQQGLQVIEYSRPAKSRHSNAVFTKTYVPVSGAHVLRVETLAADAADL